MNNTSVIDLMKEFLYHKKTKDIVKDKEEYVYVNAIKNYFENNNGKTIKKTQIINLILNLIKYEKENLDFEDVKTIYEFYGFPFNYDKENGLVDLYDICLYTFIKHNLHKESIPDIFHFENEATSKRVMLKSNRDKYEWLLENIVSSNWDENEHSDCLNDFIYCLYDITSKNRDQTNNIEKLVFPELNSSEEMKKIKKYLDIYEEKESKDALDIRQFFGVILLVFFANFYDKEKNTKKFRRVIEDIYRNYYSLAFMELLTVDNENIFSYNYYEKLYYYVFVKDNKKEKDEVFYSLFTRIITNICKYWNCESCAVHFSILNLSEKQIKNRLIKMKEGIDSSLIDKFEKQGL